MDRASTAWSSSSRWTGSARSAAPTGISWPMSTGSSCVTSTGTWWWCAASTPRPWPCSGRASWRCGPRSSDRRPPRSAPPMPCGRTTSSSRATASTASPTAWASTRCRCCGSGAGAGLSGWDPAAHGIATPAIVVGSQPLHATGYALGVTLDGASSAVLTYFGDGATSEGDVAEAFGFAASYGVPVVFFCQNNQWAISEPVRLQSHTSIAQRGQGYGIPGHPGRRQRRAGCPRRHAARPGACLGRRGSDPH